MTYFIFILDNEAERKATNQGRPAKNIETKRDKVEYTHLFKFSFFENLIATFIKLKLSMQNCFKRLTYMCVKTS